MRVHIWQGFRITATNLDAGTSWQDLKDFARKVPQKKSHPKVDVFVPQPQNDNLRIACQEACVDRTTEERENLD